MREIIPSEKAIITEEVKKELDAFEAFAKETKAAILGTYTTHNLIKEIYERSTAQEIAGVEAVRIMATFNNVGHN